MSDIVIEEIMKIVSYNILAQRFVKTPDIESFDVRINKIINSLLLEDASVICLQEVELADVERDFELLLRTYDYFGHTISKKRSSPIGNIILWKRQYEKVASMTTSAAVLVSLLIDNKKRFIANVHLKAGLIAGEKQRLAQLKSILAHNPDLICGDFNDTMSEERSAYKLFDAYKVVTPGLTCYVKDSCNHTINKPYWPFDHFIYKPEVFGVVSIIPTDLECIIPNDIHPSDHMMVIFQSE